MYCESLFLNLRVLKLFLRKYSGVFFIHISKQSRDKLDPRALRCLFQLLFYLRSYITNDVTFFASQPYLTDTFFRRRLEELKISHQKFFLQMVGMVGMVGMSFHNQWSNASTSDFTSTLPTVQDFFSPKKFGFCANILGCFKCASLGSLYWISQWTWEIPADFQWSSTKIWGNCRKIFIENSANELNDQLKEREHLLPKNTSELKVYLRNGKSTTSSHIPSSWIRKWKYLS